MTEFLIRDRTFSRPVRIENWTDLRPLVFDNCLFSGGFSARGAKIDCGLNFVGCTFEPFEVRADCKDVALDLSNARIRGDLVLFDCIVKGRLFAQGLAAKSNVRLQGCGIVPVDWEIGGAIMASKVLDKGVEDQLDGFKPKDGTEEQDTSLVVFDSATIGGHFEIFSAGKETSRRVSAGEPRVGQDDGASVIAGRVNCERIEVKGNVTLSELIVFRPTFFNASSITGNFTLRRALLLLRGGEKATDDCLRLNRINVARKLELNNADVRGGVSLYGVTVGGACDLGGLCCAGDLNLSFSAIGHLRAYRTATDSLVDRESLEVGGDLVLSAATVGVLELRGATIQRNLIAQTGAFGVFILGLGVKPWVDSSKVMFFWPKPCNVGAVSLTSLQVRETFDAGGIQVTPSYDPIKDNRQDFELLNSRIDGALVFFPPDNLSKRLQIIWSDTIPTGMWRIPQELASRGAPSDTFFPSEIRGNLIVRACRIGGDLDLRNVHLKLDDQGIVLNNTSVGLDVKAGSESKFSGNDDLTTHCRCLDGEKLSCQGDVDLSGIRIGTEVGTDAKRQPVLPDLTGAGSEAKPIQQDRYQHAGLTSRTKPQQAGDVSLHGAHITGDLLFAAADESKRSSARDSILSGIAQISGELDLTATRCEKLTLSGRSFVSGTKYEFQKRVCDYENGPRSKRDPPPRAILARGHFSQVEILDWPPCQSWSSVLAVWKQCPSNILPGLGHLLVRLMSCPFTFLKSVSKRLWESISRRIRSTSQPINLRQIAVDKWILGDGNQQESERARHYVTVLREMDPEDRSTWLKVESDLRSKSFEWQADRVYLGMAWSSMRRRRKRWFFWRPLVFLWHVVVCLAQTCFLWTKAFFVVPLAITFMTLFGLTYLFTDSLNVRATIGYLHAIAAEIRTRMPQPNEIHPKELHAEWKISDAIALALRYHIPLFESRTHDRWEASEHEVDLGTIGRFHLAPRMETIAFVIEVIYWVALPILLLGFAAWAFRKRETE